MHVWTGRVFCLCTCVLEQTDNGGGKRKKERYTNKEARMRKRRERDGKNEFIETTAFIPAALKTI